MDVVVSVTVTRWLAVYRELVFRSSSSKCWPHIASLVFMDDTLSKDAAMALALSEGQCQVLKKIVTKM